MVDIKASISRADSSKVHNVLQRLLAGGSWRMSTPPGPAAAQQISAQTFLELFPFDEALYSLEGEELDFMRTQTGIEDEDELKTHIIAITREAYAVSS